MAMSSPQDVYKAYAKQYQRDFSAFLKSRGEEMLPNGHMVLIFVGRSVEDPSTKDDITQFTLLANILLDMVAEDLIKEGDLHSFNMPIYTACRQEVESVIHSEGSFNLDKIEDFRVPWDAQVKHEFNGKNNNRGEVVANFIRAYTEPVLKTHFGSSIINDLFTRFAMKIDEQLSTEEPSSFNFVISLTRK